VRDNGAPIMYVAPDDPQALAAMNEGRYLDAAVLFERSAIHAYRANELPSMKLSASLSIKAYAMGGDAANAERLAKATVDALAAASRGPEIPGFATRVLESLRSRSLGGVADAVSQHVGAVVGPSWNDPATPKLPAFCPSCGAAVKPAEVVRPTPSTVACKYCGGSLAR